MKKQLHLKLWFLLMFLMALGTKTAWSQATDTTGLFETQLTGLHLIYAEVEFVDANENGNYDASFTLSQDTVIAWGDYSTSLAFYDEGFLVRDGGGFTSSTTIIPVPGETIKLWLAVNVPEMTYKTYVQTESMDAPEMVLDRDAAFRNTAISSIQRWSTLHNPDAEPDYVKVHHISLETNSDATLKSLSSNIGVLDPDFDSETDVYEVSVPFGTTSVTLDAVANGIGASVDMFDGLGNQIPASGEVPFSGDGVDIEIIVTAFDQTESSYYVSIFVDEGSSDANLSGIEVSEGAITPAFHIDTTTYTLIVPEGTATVDVTGIPNYPEATVSGNGTVTLSGGTGTSTLNVTSADGSTTKTYTVNVSEVDNMNYALYLPGENGNNSNVDISGLNLTTLPYTMEMWIKPDGSQPYNAGLIFNRPDNNGFQYASSWYSPANSIRYMAATDDDIYGVETTVVTEINKWHHLVVVMTDSTRTLYLDGVAKTEKSEFTAMDWSTGVLYLGWDSDNAGKAFKGWIDEVRIWNDSISADKLQEMKFEVLNGDEENLVAYYNFDLPNPTQAIDLTSNKNHGMISGGTYEESFPRVNLELSSLTIDKGSLNPDFAPGVETFYLTLPKGTTSFTIDATASDEGASVDGTGMVNITNTHDSASVTVTNEGVTFEYKIYYVVDTELTLKHSYTFADGTAKDVVSGANGEIMGGSITEGAFTSEADGDYITLPAEDIALNTYASFSIEAFVTAGVNDGYAMLGYFGGLSGSNAAWLQIARADDLSRAQLGTNGAVTQINSLEPAEGESHHYVFTINSDSMVLYIDGLPATPAHLVPNCNIASISTENAWIGESGWNDPSWLGTIYEFNIYAGAMTEEEVFDRFIAWPIDDETTDATLSVLKLDEDTIEGFAPHTLEYNVELEEGVTTPPTISADPTVTGAEVVISDATSVPGTATVTVTATDGTTMNTYTVNYTYMVGVEDVIASSIKVYPTLSNGIVTVKTRSGASQISVYDFTGKLVQSMTSNSTEERIELPRNGMYLLHIQTEGVKKAFKVFRVN